MWSSIAVVAILLAAAPSGALSAGSEIKRSLQSTPLDYAWKYCVSLPQKDGGRPTYCVPGTTFKISCNRCICRRSGMTAFCTKKNCYKLLEDDCKAGSAKVVECNICICSRAGKWACTQKQCRSGIQYVDCEGEPREATETDVAKTPFQMCVPGTSFLNGCDRCYCSNDGISAVCKSRPCNGVIGTLIQLHTPIPPEVGYPTIPENATVQNATHFCFHYGGTSVCADMVKSKGVIGDIIGELSGQVNVEGSTVLNETHACLSTTETDVCFDMGTILGVLAQLLSPDKPGTLNPTVPHFENETHICATHEGKVICIEVDRIHALQSTYVPGARGGDRSGGGCNRRGVECGDESHFRYDSPTLPGKPDFVNETHVCFIYDETVICIEQSAYRDSEQRTDRSLNNVKCVPLTSFKMDCNTCWCNSHGTGAMCTMMACPKRSTRDVSCRPGTTYKEQCNVCTCLQDGKPGGCTRMACPPGSY